MDINGNNKYIKGDIYMPKIKTRTKRNIERSIGLPLSQIVDLSIDEEISFIEKKSGKKLVFTKSNDSRRISRGNVLLALGRIMTMSEVNKKLDKIK